MPVEEDRVAVRVGDDEARRASLHRLVDGGDRLDALGANTALQLVHVGELEQRISDHARIGSVPSGR